MQGRATFTTPTSEEWSYNSKAKADCWSDSTTQLSVQQEKPFNLYIKCKPFWTSRALVLLGKIFCKC